MTVVILQLSGRMIVLSIHVNKTLIYEKEVSLPLPHTPHENEIQMDCRSNCK